MIAVNGWEMLTCSYHGDEDLTLVEWLSRESYPNHAHTQKEMKNFGVFNHVVSIDNWLKYLDSLQCTFVVHAKGN